MIFFTSTLQIPILLVCCKNSITLFSQYIKTVNGEYKISLFQTIYIYCSKSLIPFIQHFGTYFIAIYSWSDGDDICTSELTNFFVFFSVMYKNTISRNNKKYFIGMFENILISYKM